MLMFVCGNTVGFPPHFSKIAVNRVCIALRALSRLSMWITNEGERKLTGPERQLFANALDLLIDVDKGNDFDTLGDYAPEIFARLSVPDKYLVLRYVVKAILTDEPAPFRSALLEGALYTVLHYNADRWESSSPQEIAEELIDLCMQDTEFFEVGDFLPADTEAEPSRADVLRALTARVEKDGTDFIVESLTDKILSDRDFELPALSPGDPRFSLMDIDPEYWSKGPKQLRTLRDEASRANESFSVVYWDLKALYLSTVSAGSAPPLPLSGIIWACVAFHRGFLSYGRLLGAMRSKLTRALQRPWLTPRHGST